MIRTKFVTKDLDELVYLMIEFEEKLKLWAEKNVSTNFLAYPIILKNNLKFSRKQFQIHLEKNNIQTRPIFSGNSLRHPAFSSLINKTNKLNLFPNSDYIMKYGLLIGCHQGLNKNDISYIHSKIFSFIK